MKGSKFFSMVVSGILLAALHGALAADINTTKTGAKLIRNPGGTVVSNFTCDSSTHSCSCQGNTDCFDLGNSKLCKDGTIKEGNQPQQLVCDFKF